MIYWLSCSMFWSLDCDLSTLSFYEPMKVSLHNLLIVFKFHFYFMLFPIDARCIHIENIPVSLTNDWILTKQGDTFFSRDKLTPTTDRPPICICLLNYFLAFSKGIYCIYFFCTGTGILTLFPLDIGDRFPIIIFSFQEDWFLNESFCKVYQSTARYLKPGNIFRLEDIFR